MEIEAFKFNSDPSSELSQVMGMPDRYPDTVSLFCVLNEIIAAATHNSDVRMKGYNHE